MGEVTHEREDPRGEGELSRGADFADVELADRRETRASPPLVPARVQPLAAACASETSMEEST